MTRIGWLALVSALASTACAPQHVRVSAVEKTVHGPLAKSSEHALLDVLKACPVYRPSLLSVQQAVSLADKRRASQITCNARICAARQMIKYLARHESPANVDVLEAQAKHACGLD